jgi:DUSAM domain-containing protein
MSEWTDEDQVNAAQREDWAQLRELELQLQQGRTLELTDAVRELLKRTALQVAFSAEDAERGLRSPAEAAILVTRIERRMREGSQRVGQAIWDVASRAAAGNAQSARPLVKAALANEVVPYYRELLEAMLHAADTFKI